MILLTGASGFVGQHLLRALVRVYGTEQVVALTSVPISGVRCLLSNNYYFERDFFKSAGIGEIEAVIHAGAYTPKSGAEANDWARCNENISGTDRLLKALPVRTKLLFISTLDVYGEGLPISENTPLRPASLYGHSKAYGERMVECWGKATASTIQVLRLGHIYGPGEKKYRKIIPETFGCILAGKAPRIWGSGSEIRSFIYIDDVINLILKALALDAYADPINICGGSGIRIKELVKAISEIAESSMPIEYLPASGATRDMLFDTSKMTRILGPEQIGLREGLAQEWEHMRRVSGA